MPNETDEDSPDCHHDYYTIPEECIAEELTGNFGIYQEIVTPASILRPDYQLVQDEMIPRPKIAWSPSRKVTFGKSALIFILYYIHGDLDAFSQFESIQPDLCPTGRSLPPNKG